MPGLDQLVIKGATQASLSASWLVLGRINGIQLGYGTADDGIFLRGVGTLPSDSIILAG